MIEKFKSYLINIRGYSQNTAQAYTKDVQDFAKFMQQHRTDAKWTNITLQDIDAYIYHCCTLGMKPATTNRRLSSISGIYVFFKHEGLDVDNPCKWENRRKLEEKMPNTIPVNELIEAYNNAFGVAKVALGLFMTTGIRIQELLDMTWEDIDFGNNSIKIHGKGRKERIVFTTEDKLEVLNQLNTIQPHHGKIFQLEQRALRRLIFDALRPFCHAPQLSPHAIRHTFATNAANNGANVSTLGQILGHKRLETTQRYIDMQQAPLRQFCTRYNMFNN